MVDAFRFRQLLSSTDRYCPIRWTNFCRVAPEKVSNLNAVAVNYADGIFIANVAATLHAVVCESTAV